MYIPLGVIYMKTKDAVGLTFEYAGKAESG